MEWSGSGGVAPGLKHQSLVPLVPREAGGLPFLGQVSETPRFPWLPGNRNVQIPLYDSFVVQVPILCGQVGANRKVGWLEVVFIIS
jgi:hypothetical protein